MRNPLSPSSPCSAASPGFARFSRQRRSRSSRGRRRGLTRRSPSSTAAQMLDAQAVVSNDLKYVTINARPSSSQLLALREFSFASSDAAPRLGFVGGAGAGRTRRQRRGPPNVARPRRA